MHKNHINSESLRSAAAYVAKSLPPGFEPGLEGASFFGGDGNNR